MSSLDSLGSVPMVGQAAQRPGRDSHSSLKIRVVPLSVFKGDL